MPTIDLAQLTMDTLSQQAAVDPRQATASAQAMQKSTMATTVLSDQALQATAASQVNAADKAQQLQQEAAALTTKDSNNVLTMYEHIRDSTRSGIATAERNLTASIDKKAQAAELDATRPSLFTNPLAAISMAWKSASLEDQVDEHKATAHSLAVDVNSLIQLGRVQLEDTIAANNLRSTALLTERSAELSKGVAQQQIESKRLTDQAALYTKTSKELFDTAKQGVDWDRNAQALRAQRRQIELQGQQLKLANDKFELELKQGKDFNAAVENTAEMLAQSKLPDNVRPTEAQRQAARAAARILATSDPEQFSSLNLFGQKLRETGNPALAKQQFFKDGTVAQLQTLGAVSNSPAYRNFGADAAESEFNRIRENALRDAYAVSKSPLKFDMWLADQPASVTNAVDKAARAAAVQQIRSMPIGEILTANSAKLPFGTGGIRLTELGNANRVAAMYGYPLGSKENAALSSPDFVRIVQDAQVLGGNSRGTELGLTAMHQYLKQAGVKLPEKVMSKIALAQQRGSLRDTDADFSTALAAGYSTTTNAFAALGEERYDVGTEAGMRRYLARAANPKKSIFESMFSIWGSESNPNLSPKERRDAYRKRTIESRDRTVNAVTGAVSNFFTPNADVQEGIDAASNIADAILGGQDYKSAAASQERKLQEGARDRLIQSGATNVPSVEQQQQQRGDAALQTRMQSEAQARLRQSALDALPAGNSLDAGTAMDLTAAQKILNDAALQTLPSKGSPEGGGSFSEAQRVLQQEQRAQRDAAERTIQPKAGAFFKPADSSGLQWWEKN